MKKRLFAWALLLAMLVSLFAGCTPKDPDPTDAPTQPTVGEADLKALEDALEYIKTVYKNAGELTPKDFQRIGVVPVGGVKYEVVWTVDVGEDIIKIVTGDNGMVTIDVNEEVTEEVKYVLTATITDAYGNSVSHSWNHTIPATMSGTDIVDQAYALEPGEALDFESTLTGKIMSIDTPWSEDYQNITVTIVIEGREDKPIQCYRLTGDGAKDLAIGDTITVTGTLKNYSGTIEFDSGCKLDAVVKGDGVAAVAPEDPKQIVAEAYALAPGASLLYTAELTGVITKVNTPWDSGYGNITVTIVVEGCEDQPIMCYRLKGDGAEDLAKGDTITVTGNIKNYNGTIEFVQGCILKNVIPGSRETVSAPTSTQEILNDALALQPGDTLEYQAQLTGVITKKFDWNATYNDVNLYMDVNGTEIYVYGLKGLSSDFLKKGDTLTVYGYITNYNGTIEFNKPTYVSHEPGEGGEEEPTDPITSNMPAITTSISNGDKVIIYAPAYGVALSAEKTGFYNAGVALSYSGGTVSGAGSSAIWTVIQNSDGTYSFSNGGQNIGLADSFSSMDLGAVNDDWQLIDLGGGLCNLYNTGRGNYMEWYDQYSNWSTYGTSSAATDDQFQLSFCIVEKGSTTPEETTPTDPEVTTPTTPTEPEVTVPAVTVADGSYVIWNAAAGKAMGALAEGKTYGYPPEVAVTLTDGVLSGYAETDVYTIKNNDNGTFSLVDGYGRTMYMTGSFNSFNLATDASDITGAEWVLEDAGDGLYYVKNVEKGKYLAYSASFTSYGIYADQTEGSLITLTLISEAETPDVTDPTNPEVTDPTEPEVTDPTDPTVTDPTDPSETDPVEPEAPFADGDKIVIYAPAYNKALSVTKTGNYNVGVDVTVTDGVMSGYGETEIFTVIANEDGTYSFANSEQNIGMADSYSSMNLGAANDKWTLIDLGDGLYNLQNVGRSNYMEWYNQYSNWSTYNSSNAATDDQFQLSFYIHEKAEPAGLFTDGDNVVIYAPAYNKALSVTKTGNYNVGVDVTVTDGVMSGYGETEIFTVIANEDGTYSFANGEQNIGMADSYSSMNLGAANDKWTLIDLGDGLYNLQNVGRSNYMEWYNQYSNWSTYNSSNAATDDQFQLSFYVVEDTAATPEETTPTETTPEATVISNTSDALAAETGAAFIVKGVVTLLDGSNIYIQDETGAICARVSSAPTDLAVGDTVIASGTKASYNGLPQLSGSTYEKSEGLTLAAKETTIAALTTADVCTYVHITGVVVTEVYDNNGAYTSPNITVQDADGNTIQIYKAVVNGEPGAWEIQVGNHLDIYAAVGVYNSTFQLRNTSASEITILAE